MPPRHSKRSVAPTAHNLKALVIAREQQLWREAVRGKKTACDPGAVRDLHAGEAHALTREEVAGKADGHVKVRALRLERQDKQMKETARRNSSKWPVRSDSTRVIMGEPSYLSWNIIFTLMSLEALLVYCCCCVSRQLLGIAIPAK